MLKTAAMEISANWIKYSTCGQFINKTEKLHHWIFIFITSFSVCKFKKQGYTDKQKREAGVNDTSVKEKAGFFSSSGGRSVNRLLHRWLSHTHTGRPTDLTGGHINTSKESSIQKHIPRSVWTTAVFFVPHFCSVFCVSEISECAVIPVSQNLDCKNRNSTHLLFKPSNQNK